MRLAQKPITYIVFPSKKQWHQRKGDIVQRRGDGRRQEIGADYSGDSQGEQGLKSPERHEPEEHPNRRARSDRVATILELNKLSTFLAKPSRSGSSPKLPNFRSYGTTDFFRGDRIRRGLSGVLRSTPARRYARSARRSPFRRVGVSEASRFASSARSKPGRFAYAGTVPEITRLPHNQRRHADTPARCAARPSGVSA